MNKRERKKIMINFNLIDKIKISWMIINIKYCDENENEKENDNDNDNDNDNKVVYKVGVPAENDKSRRFEILWPKN